MPQNDQIWPKIGIFGQFGPGHAGLFNALLWVGWWLWRAGCISQDTYLLYSTIQFGQLFHFFSAPRNIAVFFRKSDLVYVFAHRVVFEENRAVFVVDVDQAGDHHEDEEAEDCNHNHLRTIRERVHKSERKNLTTT